MIICSPELGISPESHLGGEVHDRETLLALANLGAQIYIILPKNKPHPQHPNIHIKSVFTPIIYPPWLFNLIILPYLFYLYQTTHFKYLRIHSPYFVGFGAIIFKYFNPQVKLIATYHHTENTRLIHLINNILLKHFDRIITVSQSSKRSLLAITNVNPENILVIPNGVAEKLVPQPKDPTLISKYHLENKTVLLYLGQLSTRKNLTLLLEMMVNLPEKYTLLIAGTGPTKQQLIREVKSKNLSSSVTFLGYIEEIEKPLIYNLADIFLYPSLLEGFGLAPVEASACGIPVIVSSDPALSELPYVYSTPPVASNWVTQVLKISSKPPNLNKRGQISRSIHHLFSWQSAARNYLSLLNDLKLSK